MKRFLFLIIIISGVIIYTQVNDVSERRQLSADYSILASQFADKQIEYILSDQIRGDINRLLQDAIDGVGARDELERLEKRAEEFITRNAVDIKNMILARAKLCIARTLIEDDLKEALPNCGYEDIYPEDFDWSEEVDDVTASSQVMPFYITAEHFEELGDGVRASYYYEQIVNHKDAGVDWLGDKFIDAAGDVYGSIVDSAQDYLITE